MELGLFSTEGRIRRQVYWLRFLFIFVISMSLQGIIMLLLGLKGEPFIIGVRLAAALCTIIQAVKRMHDVDKDGWFIFVPIYNIILLVSDGTPGRNKYGSDPKKRSEGFVCPECQTVNGRDATQCERCNCSLIVRNVPALDEMTSSRPSLPTALQNKK